MQLEWKDNEELDYSSGELRDVSFEAFSDGHWNLFQKGGEHFKGRALSRGNAKEMVERQYVELYATRSFQADGHPAQIEIGGALTSPGPDFSLIPTVGLTRLAERFMLGEVRKGKKAWNAMSSNQDVLVNREFLVNRLGHIIHHALKLRDKVANDLPFDDDDAGAIAWGGIFAICATDAIERQRAEKLPTE